MIYPPRYADLLAIEHAALAAWPAREVEHQQGWLLRASDGITKRANSATVLVPADADINARIDACEMFYHQRGLPCIIRLPSFVEHGHLDRTLADRAYSFRDFTLVLHRSLEALPATTGSTVCYSPERHTWLTHFAALAGLDANSQAGQADILARIQGMVLTAILEQHGEVLCAGLGVLDGSQFGIFDVFSRADRRRQGLASQLIAWMLAQAIKHGARDSYLQVVGANHPAISTYERLGYRRIYDYWYRIAAAENTPR